MTTTKVRIETDRLELCEFTVDDAPFILTLLNTPKWLAFIGDRGVHNLDGAQRYVQERLISSYMKFGFGLYLTRLKAEGTRIGMCGLVKREHLDDVDIGFAFMPEYEKSGYAAEAAGATLAYARDKLKLKRVVAISMKDNERSVRLLRKLGFEFEKMVSSPGEQDLMLFSTQWGN